MPLPRVCVCSYTAAALVIQQIVQTALRANYIHARDISAPRTSRAQPHLHPRRRNFELVFLLQVKLQINSQTPAFRPEYGASVLGYPMENTGKGRRNSVLLRHGSMVRVHPRSPIPHCFSAISKTPAAAGNSLLSLVCPKVCAPIPEKVKVLVPPVLF